MDAVLKQHSFVGKRLMWVDDRVSIHRSLIGRFEDRGVIVAPLESVEDALAELARHSFDSVLLDAMIGHESSLPQIPRILEAANGANFNVCSGFMYREHLQEQRKRAEEQTGARIGTIEKIALPDPDDMEPIDRFLARIFFGEEAAGQISTKVEVPKILALSYSAYERLSFEDRMLWLDESEPLIRAVADDYFSKGYIYLLFCGSLDAPALSITDPADIPPEEDMLRFAQNEGFAPLAIHFAGIVDDIPGQCGTGLQSYPTLTVSALDGESEDVHFDTGASKSLMSYEWYAEKGWIPFARSPALVRAGEMTLQGVRYAIPACKFTDVAGSTRITQFEAYYIIEWRKTRLSVNCGLDCRNNWSRTSNPKTCRFRTGLLGRSLPRDELCVQFSIDFTTGKVRFVE